MQSLPSNFTNLGDWLIWRSTGTFGDFKMNVCIALIKTERYSRGWVDAMTDDDIRRVLARYKEHVTYWNIPITTIQTELRVFAEAVGRNPQAIMTEFDMLPAQRLPINYRDGKPIPRF